LSPLVRKMAREHSIDLSRVRGTGAGGRISKQDLEAYIAQSPAGPQEVPAAPAAKPAAPTPAPAAPAAYQAPAGQAKTRIEPMSAMRIKIAEHMVMSKRTSPHVTTIHRVDMTKVARLRERYKEQFLANYGFSLTYLPFIARASVAALRQFPLVNASLDGNNIVYHNEIHIGIAVALENGLIVPVIRNADEKNALGLQRSIVDLAARARSRQLKPEEVLGGTFSITNFGSYGSLVGTPVINQPQVAILGVGTVDKTPVVIDDAIAIRSICHLSLSFDHRLIDGALADQFMSKVKQVLEGWSEEVL
jgi:2-oxoglutarate dehydrogenase E2 component (dihydrolipoamide succinyltransferase)